MTQPSRYQNAARALLRDTLLDVAGELLEEAPWSEITMITIASKAGVSRQTLYKEFGTREEFAQAYVLREANRFVDSVEAELERLRGNPSEAVRACFSLFLQETEHNPVVTNLSLRDDGSDELFTLFTTRGGPVVRMATTRVSAKMAEIWPNITQKHAEVLASLLVRVAISHAGLPEGSANDAADDVIEVVEPFLHVALPGQTLPH
ncbi:MAG: TetR family transcriptional regulator [Solirubrobacterales bacterium]